MPNKIPTCGNSALEGAVVVFSWFWNKTLLVYCNENLDCPNFVSIESKVIKSQKKIILLVHDITLLGLFSLSTVVVHSEF